MPSAEQLRSRLLKKLSELFQLDQPDLDFGFYRIMHAKAREVQDFIGKDLLKIVADAFGDEDRAREAELQAAYAKAIQTARDFGAPNPEETEPVKKAQAALDAVKDTASAEADVYDHLYRFFERYYDDGDFISRRYYTRETSGKAAPFAVPYNGEEVKLHWANADQYYIKTSEYFSNFTFDLRQAPEIRTLRQQNQIGLLLGVEDDSPLKVHFRVVEATEGEHGNVKASEDSRRFFILHAENPVALTETGELVVNFEYRPDPEKTGQEGTWRDKRNAESVETILERLQILAAAGGEEATQVAEYLHLLKIPAPTDSDKKRPLLAKYVNKYTARNTMDYFIHKDLGGFLRRELDFYIKNEVMRLDDIENAEAPAVESYLSKIKVLRRIAGKLIDFLASLEDFQKKLWLKKKFITETNYGITLDRIPEELYAIVAANEAQCEEWIRLFSIDEIQGDLLSPGFSRPLTVDFLKANDKLVLDTRFFDDSFKARLVASIENFDEQCDGLLIHSENFQALNLLQERYREQVKCVYIDPPYNTENDEFPYKDGYQASSWFSMMLDRASAASALMSGEGLFFQQIGDDEAARSRLMLEEIFAERKNSVVARRGIKNVQAQFEDISRLSLGHDLIHIFSKKRGVRIPHLHQLLENGKSGKWDTFWRGTDRPTMRYELLGQHPETGQWRWEKNRAKKASQNYELFLQNKSETKPLDEWYAENLQAGVDLDFVRKNNEGTVQYYVPPQTFKLVSDNWLDIPSSGTFTDFPHEKSLALLQRIIGWITSPGELVLDYFAGSGSTGHAAIHFTNTEARKYLLCEMGNYFDTMLKPRIAKVIYSESWKDGKPTARHAGISHCFKYIRLESYEDTLNNLRFDEDPQREKTLAANPSLKEDYMLRYLLDVETRGSQSLLNIDAFADPTAYTLEVKKPGTDEYATRAVDLIETFNYLIGLRVLHSSVPQTFQATFKRVPDPELPEDQHTKLVVDGRIRQDEGGPWWFRKVEGWVPKDPGLPGNGQQEKVLIVWRKLTDDIEQDNLMLDEWFQKNRISTRDFEFDTIYVNGSNNLPNLKRDDENWKVRLIEEEFMKRMWEADK
ncbi:site-specific DNA-methyltransferase [Aminirod propionatiphilus]|uniref:Site-specific DNA-methyltransferase n=2 Tax=Aminirod propionatiphilus TaxID=3415223 RepID=A0ACD1DZU3_9BACT|nr:site-specific DNA-methyltransferase [Synergistota bacterium]